MPEISERPLPLSLFRCPRTGGRLKTLPDGTWLGPEGDRYPEIEGLRSLVAANGEGKDAAAALWESLSRSSSVANSANYLSPANFQRTMDAVRRMAEPLANVRILDVGCGCGAMSVAFAKGNHVIGVDFSPSLLRRAAEAGLEVYLADATRLPFQAGLFDRVFCINLIQHIPEPQVLIKSLEEATRPGGELLIVSLNRECLLRRAFRLLLNLGLFRPRGIIPIVQSLSFGQLALWLNETALEVIEVGMTFAPTTFVGRRAKPGVVSRLLGDTYYVRLRKRSELH
jgi:2-polyprenyl-6-hydroxyphenyl methylase / 3-demethylubiquinone-9 3-methyltransferase